MIKLFCSMSIMLYAICSYSAPDLGNEVAGDDGRPRSISINPCERRMSWERYKEYQSEVNPEFKPFFSFVKSVYPYVFRKIEKAASNTIICETKHELSANIGYIEVNGEEQKKRIALWKPKGEINKDLLLIDIKRFYSIKVSDAGRAATLFREFLHPAFFKDNSDIDQVEWAKHNVVNTYYQVYSENKNYEEVDILDMISAYGLYLQDVNYIVSDGFSLIEQLIEDCAASAQTCQNIMDVRAKSKLRMFANDTINLSDAYLYALIESDFLYKKCFQKHVLNVHCLQQTISLHDELERTSLFMTNYNYNKHKSYKIRTLLTMSKFLHDNDREADFLKLKNILLEQPEFKIKAIRYDQSHLSYQFNYIYGTLNISTRDSKLVQRTEFIKKYFSAEDFSRLIRIDDFSWYNHDGFSKYIVYHAEENEVKYLVKTYGSSLVKYEFLENRFVEILPSHRKSLKGMLEYAKKLSIFVEAGLITRNREENDISFVMLLSKFSETKSAAKILKKREKMSK